MPGSPGGPENPGNPVIPLTPLGPVNPGSPGEPLGPWGPGKPSGPGNPFWPGAPGGPGKPFSPFSPLVPSQKHRPLSLQTQPLPATGAATSSTRRSSSSRVGGLGAVRGRIVGAGSEGRRVPGPTGSQATASTARRGLGRPAVKLTSPAGQALSLRPGHHAQESRKG